MTIYYLYVKTHNITGLKYLGKTSKDPYKYLGSGIDWCKHLERYGTNVTTEIIKICETPEDFSYWGRYYSKLWNIVEGQDDYGNKIWANRIPETGSGSNMNRKMHDPVIKEKHRKACIRAGQDPSVRKKRSISQSIRANREPSQTRMKLNNPSQLPHNRKRLSNARLSDWKSEDYRSKMSGKSHYKHDNTIYTFVHSSGLIERCTSRELAEKYTLQHTNLRSMILKRRRICQGWTLGNEL